MVVHRLDVTRPQKSVVIVELRLIQERKNSLFFKEGTHSECHHISDSSYL